MTAGPAGEYLDAVVRRNRTPMEPLDFEPDWADQPRRHSVYPGVRPMPLPDAEIPLAGLDRSLSGPVPVRGGAFTTTMLAGLLRESYGCAGRRLGITANGDAGMLSRYAHAVWSRGTASGGGLYPLEIYWVRGARGPVLPGVYNYSAPLHAVQRLLVGDVTGRVRAAIAPVPDTVDQFLLVTVRFWKNAFKYRAFCYHAVTMDVGAVLGTWQMWSRAAGTPLRPLLDFDEEALNGLLGLRTHEESVFAVVPLPGDQDPPTGPAPPGAAEVDVTARPLERSRRVVRHPLVEQVHLATVGTRVGGPDRAGRLASARPAVPTARGGAAVGLDGPRPLRGTVRTALRARRSSFGRLSAHRPLGQAELSAVLRAGVLGGRLGSDVKDPAGTPELTRLAVFANHVEGVPRAAYDYDPAAGALLPVGGDDDETFLQRNYFLTNYNLEQAAAVAVVLARPHAVLSAVGQRGLRFLNAEVGATAQAMYVASAALGIGCGAALGFDNVSYAERLRGDPGRGAADDEWPLLIVLLGHERDGLPDFHFRLT